METGSRIGGTCFQVTRPRPSHYDAAACPAETAAPEAAPRDVSTVKTKHPVRTALLTLLGSAALVASVSTGVMDATTAATVLVGDSPSESTIYEVAI